MKNIESNNLAAAAALRSRSLIAYLVLYTLICIPTAGFASKPISSLGMFGITASPRQVAHFRIDKTFNSTGSIIDRYSGGNDFAAGAILLPDGKLLVGVRSSGQGLSSVELIRINENGTRDLSFGDGCKLTSTGGFPLVMAFQTDGKVLLSGPPTSLLRCNLDGTRDVTFGSGGILQIESLGFSIGRIDVQQDGKILLGGNLGGVFTLARIDENGSRDLTFGDGGLASSGQPNSQMNSMVVQPDGKIVAAGASGGDFALIRFNGDGTLDTTFDQDGRLTTQIFSGNEAANKVVLQPDGKIVAAGFALNSPLSTSGVFALVRYNPDGSLDTSFDADGKVATPFTNNGTVMLASNIFALTILPNGGILAGGQAHNGWNYDHALARYNADGAVDSKFGISGFVVEPFPISIDHIDDSASHIFVRPDGRIVTVGYDLNWHGGQDLSLRGFDADGSADNSFGTGGKTILDIGGNRTYGTALAIQTDGKIVAAGLSATGLSGTGQRSHIARYHPNGSRDTSFGGLGFVTAPGQVKDLAVGSDGKILTVGDGGLCRFNSDGSLDTSFDGDGQVPGISSTSRVLVQSDGKVLTLTSAQVSRRNVDGSLDSSFDSDGMAPLSFGSSLFELASDGKIVVGGSWNGNFTVARLNADGSPDAGFDGDGVVTTDVAGSDQVTSIALQPDGKIVAAGWSNCCDFNQRRTALVRYNSDGSLDTSFGESGKLEFPNSNFGEVSNMYVRPDGKIVTLARSITSQRVFRLTADGQPDTAFYGDGIAAFGNNRFSANPIPLSTHVEFDVQGRIVLMGTDRPQPSFNDNRSLWIGRMEMIDHPYVHFDFSGDGKADLAVYRPSTRAWHVMTPDRYTVTQFGQSGDKPVPADYDGDGISDLAVYRLPDNRWTIRSSESQTESVLGTGGFGDLGIPVPSDRDGDGYDEPAIYRFNFQPTFGVPGDSPVRGDFDGDGSSDIAVYRPSNHNWYIRSTSYSQGFYMVQWGEEGDVPVPADYDGDGATDIAVWRPATGQWWIMGSSAGWMVGTFWGEPGDKPVPADYDGDGKTDVAVWRPSNGTWYIVQSADSSILVQQFGEDGDIPLPSAFIH